MDRALPILCENCGYDVDSLVARLGAEPGLKCPECAKAIAESLPTNRPGTPWQRRKNALTYAATLQATTRHPVQVWRIAQSDPDTSILFGLLNTVLTVIAWIAVVWRHVAPSDFRIGFGATIAQNQDAIAFVLSCAMCALFALWLIRVVTRFFIRAINRWNVSRQTLALVTDHTCLALLTGPVLFVAADGFRAWVGSAMTPPFEIAVQSFRIASVVLPILLFAAWSASGARAMRFANPPRP